MMLFLGITKANRRRKPSFDKRKIRTEYLEMVSAEFLASVCHLQRKIDNAVEFTRFYDFVEKPYCLDNGRHSVDPMVLLRWYYSSIFIESTLSAEPWWKSTLISHIGGSLDICYTNSASFISYNLRHCICFSTLYQIYRIRGCSLSYFILTCLLIRDTYLDRGVVSMLKFYTGVMI